MYAHVNGIEITGDAAEMVQFVKLHAMDTHASHCNCEDCHDGRKIQWGMASDVRTEVITKPVCHGFVHVNEFCEHCVPEGTPLEKIRSVLFPSNDHDTGTETGCQALRIEKAQYGEYMKCICEKCEPNKSEGIAGNPIVNVYSGSYKVVKMPEDRSLLDLEKKMEAENSLTSTDTVISNDKESFELDITKDIVCIEAHDTEYGRVNKGSKYAFDEKAGYWYVKTIPVDTSKSVNDDILHNRAMLRAEICSSKFVNVE